MPRRDYRPPRLDPETGCFEWRESRDEDGYGRYSAGSRRGQLVHRAIWEEAYGPIPEGLLVCHRCDNPPCFRLKHLFLGTPLDNMRDASEKGRLHGSGLGEAHHNAKLTEAAVREIRRRYTAGDRQSEIAASFSVSQTLISQVVSRKVWGHVE